VSYYITSKSMIHLQFQKIVSSPVNRITEYDTTFKRTILQPGG